MFEYLSAVGGVFQGVVRLGVVIELSIFAASDALCIIRLAESTFWQQSHSEIEY